MNDEQIHEFIGAARWFGGKGRTFQVGSITPMLTVRDDERTVTDLLVAIRYDDAAGSATAEELYQLPLVLYAESRPQLEHAAVGTWDEPDLGAVHAYDAVHDTAAMHLLLHGEDASSEAVWHRLDGCPELGDDIGASAFSGEQSNSTVLFGDVAALKVFRKLTPGENPDITTHRALTEAGSTHIAALYGWLEWSGGRAAAEERDGGSRPFQLALLQEFLRTASDGWELALASIRNLYAEADVNLAHAEQMGGDFAGEAARLGAALADVHEQLRAAFPTSTVPAREVVAGMQQRLRSTVEVVPDLAPFVDQLRERYDAPLPLADLSVQRVHGDLHLGQTMRTVSGWKLVDFEGEPAKSLEERLRPDTPWRDVAGMLRSFDYAAHALIASHEAENPELADTRRGMAQEWAQRNQVAFLTAYAGGDPATLLPARELTAEEDATITAYLADKAVYECLYEARNRPTWLDIPLDAIARLVGAA